MHLIKTTKTRDVSQRVNLDQVTSVKTFENKYYDDRDTSSPNFVICFIFDESVSKGSICWNFVNEGDRNYIFAKIDKDTVDL